MDGLKGGEFNFYNGTNYPSFPIAPGNTAMGPDPSHSYGPVFHQIGADLDSEGNGIPGNGKMNGFVKSYAEDAGGGDGSTIMGYHTAVNVPVYDARHVILALAIAGLLLIPVLLLPTAFMS